MMDDFEEGHAIKTGKGRTVNCLSYYNLNWRELKASIEDSAPCR